MLSLQRHQLLRLRDSAWQRLLADTAHLAARPALTLWAHHGHPVVVSRQAPGLPADTPLAAGLPAPLSLGRARIALALRADEVLFVDAFPLAAEVLPTLGAPQRAGWQALCAQLDALEVPARVYGSHGWQQLTGLGYVRPGSDLDLLLPVSTHQQADAVVRVLAAAPAGLPRLDGELLWPDGAAVAWREWAAWRAGQVGALLVRRIDGVDLVEAWSCDPCLQSA
ncbi:malonate decarboxylase holo-[acyl-carrier-protein] synthase [Ideonella oryzae]|uniref:Malonate decarboxylase holo-[acyl-carrier-protein] synthase n=1 Tax=Ideonella oryzae TaxID=2937441 RepID=A0ABT1BG36_9BURK|nr:malonate decarboxylase holo-[acyl-carrier-protein] synthase [Ideonella oryzae]MCO5975196.1 malonate decarboxylase holo-[acyl-carrier-protein] synthase [Ideonella oryzae]